MPPRIHKLINQRYYHAYNRGFLKMKIFRNNRDCERFLNKAAYYAYECGVKIYSYALMENHFHFLLSQKKEGGIENFMRKLQQSHAIYSNIKYKKKGPVFGGRFKAKPVTKNDYYREIQRYIANNPIKAKISTEENSLINSSSTIPLYTPGHK